MKGMESSSLRKLIGFGVRGVCMESSSLRKLKTHWIWSPPSFTPLTNPYILKDAHAAPYALWEPDAATRRHAGDA